MEPVSYPQEMMLRSKGSVVIRLMTSDDEQELYRFFNELPQEDRQFLRNDVTRPELVHSFAVDENHNTVVALVALMGDQIVASAQLQRSNYGWTTHIGEIRVVIAHEYQKQGLGIALCRLLMKHAIAAGLEKIMAEVPVTRSTVAKAFEKLGFQREAVLKRHVKDITGRKCDLAIYTNDVSHIWERMESLVSDYNPTLGE